MEMRDILAYFSIKNEGVEQKILIDLDNKVKVNQSDIDKMKETLKYPYITIIDKNYPEMLKRIKEPPIVLFYKGDLKLLNYDSEIIAKESAEGVRMIHAFDTNFTNTGIELKTVIACECHDDMDMLVEKMNDAHSVLNEMFKLKQSRDSKQFER